MTWYRVLLRGQGIDMPIENKPAIGFFTIRAVKAASAEEAVIKAKAMVADLWASPEYTKQNKGAAPVLATEEVAEVTWWQARKIPNKGHIFYGAE